MSNKKQDCEVCGSGMSDALTRMGATRCKDCDKLAPRDRINLSIQARAVKYLGLIYRELKFIRNRLSVPEGGENHDDPEDTEDAKDVA